MLKKILSIILSVVMLCSMAVIAGANTETKTEWVENFDSYASADFGVSSASSLWVTNAGCQDGHTPYHTKESGHYHLNDGWAMQTRDFNAGYTDSDASYKAWSLRSGEHGKKNIDKSLYANSIRGKAINLKNNFGGTPVDLLTGKALGFSFDFYDASSQIHASHKNVDRHIYATVTLAKDGAEDIADVELKLGTITYASLTPAVGSSSLGPREAWNDFEMFISKDKVMMQAASSGATRSFDVADYDPSAGTWAAANDSGYYVKSIKSIEVNFVGTTAALTRENGIDNLKAWVEDEMPAEIADKQMPVFTNFAATKSISVSSSWNYLKDAGGGNVNTILGYVAYGGGWGDVFKNGIYNDEAGTAKGNGVDGLMKIATQNPATMPSAYDGIVQIGTDVGNTLAAAAGDTVQFSTDFNIIGDTDTTSSDTWFSVNSNFASGAGTVLSVAADGTVTGTDVKLNQNTWYSLDILYELEEAATVATVYIDGVELLKETVSGNQATIRSGIPTTYFTYRMGTTSDATRMLENTCYLDNFCYHIFKGGVGAYNFDKSLETANNKVIKAATEDFVNGIIAPVAADWTVGEFNALGVANASVIDIAEGGTETVVTDTAALLKDKTIKITGDYGKDMYYTVSSEGATFVTKDYLVIAKQDGEVLANNGTCAAGASISAVAYDKAGTGNIIFAAEYSGKQLVKVEIGEAYAPTTAGNTIKLFAWTDSEKIVPVVPVTTLTVGE